MKIRNRYTGEVIFEDDAKTIRETVENAIKQKSDLRRSDLRGSDLSGSNLRGSDLRGSNLSWSDLRGSDLSWSKIEFFNFPSIRTISAIRLHDLPDNLTIELMRRDALAHPHPELFDEWAKDGKCPYENVEAFWLFEPKKILWSPGLPTMADRDLILELCRFQGWYIRNYLPMPESKKSEKE